MATYTASSAQTNASGFFLAPPKYNEKGVQARSAAFTFATSASSGDVVQMFGIPKGAEVLDVSLTIGGMATGSNVAASVGDGNVTNRYIASASAAAGVAGGAVLRMNTGTGAGYSYSAEDTLDVVVGTVGSMSGQMVLRLTAFYVFDQAADGNS